MARQTKQLEKLIIPRHDNNEPDRDFNIYFGFDNFSYRQQFTLISSRDPVALGMLESRLLFRGRDLLAEFENLCYHWSALRSRCHIVF